MKEAVDLRPFKKLLLQTCGHSFEKEREQTLSAGLCRRMATLLIDMFEDYYSLLLRDRDELLCLTELLTVNETYFFREPEHLNLLVDTLLPEFVAGSKKRPVRIVSAGCSTGEEPYSIAILLRERFGADCERLFAITGVDIDSTVVASARQGMYEKYSFRGMNQLYLERYFEPSASGRYRVCETIRKQVEFEVVNLLSAAYPHSMQLPDFILYRNVSIYFPGQVQREIFGKLSGLLSEGGCLLVGASETLHHDIGILSLVKKGALFYYLKAPPLVFEDRRTSRRYISNPEWKPVDSQQVAGENRVTFEAHSKRQQGTPVHVLNDVLRTGQPDVRESFDAAVELAHKKQNDEALAILDAIIDQDVTFEKAYCLKGGLLLSLSRYDEAHTTCMAVLNRDDLCLEAHLMLGIIARQKGDDNDAIKRFREAIYLDSSCWPAHFYTAEIRYAQKDEKRARSCYEAAARILEKVPAAEHGCAFFPLLFNEEHFMAICRHKLMLLTDKKG